MIMAEDFLVGGELSIPYDLNYTMDGILKLLMYGTLVKARTKDNDLGYIDVVREELNLFPYDQKTALKVSIDDCVV